MESDAEALQKKPLEGRYQGVKKRSAVFRDVTVLSKRTSVMLYIMIGVSAVFIFDGWLTYEVLSHASSNLIGTDDARFLPSSIEDLLNALSVLTGAFALIWLSYARGNAHAISSSVGESTSPFVVGQQNVSLWLFLWWTFVILRAFAWAMTSNAESDEAISRAHVVEIFAYAIAIPLCITSIAIIKDVSKSQTAHVQLPDEDVAGRAASTNDDV
ncbi:MAG: hypothetical protein SGJ05_07010 [bacterium]|nr:hypothetical protein [bacterium]